MFANRRVTWSADWRCCDTAGSLWSVCPGRRAAGPEASSEAARDSEPQDWRGEPGSPMAGPS
eukprot:5140607-Pyramimonas_sp.AAC.1